MSDTSTVPTIGVPVVVDWELTDTSDGLDSYQLQVRFGDGDWTALGLTSDTSSTSRRTVPVGTSFRFRVRAIDRSGRTGDWASTRDLRASAVSDTSTAIDWTGSWAIATHASYLGDRVHWTNIRGSTASISFSGSSMAWFGPLGSTRGKSRVYVDGQLVATVDQYSAAFHAREMVYAGNYDTDDHTVRVEALGTSGRPTVAIDGMYVLGPG